MAAPASFPGPVLPNESQGGLTTAPSTAGGATSGGSEPVRICGVPEHFNIPWRRAAAAFRREGVDARWKELRGGTGEMIEQIRSGAQDVAVALTEGIMSAVASSMGSAQPLRYAGGFVMSPLMWMVATGYERARDGGDAQSLAQIAAKDTIRVAISRLGSGSHLMAYLLAQREGWPFEKLVFITRGDFFKIRACAFGERRRRACCERRAAAACD
jgi:ABC-type nitrate/sulfonate/bicarbonate transport system substrate-binding protein